jgi:hypothetical protein
LNDALAGFQVGDHADDTAILALRHVSEANQSLSDQGAHLMKPAQALAGSP